MKKANYFGFVTLLTGALCMVLLWADAVQADTIHLKNGRKVIGTLIGQTRSRVSIRVGRRTRHYSKRKIRRITYGLVSTEKKKQERARKRLLAKKRRLARLRRLARQKEAKRRAAETKRRAEEARKLAAEAKRIAAEKQKGKRLAAERALAVAKKRAAARERAAERKQAREKRREAARIARLEKQVKRDEDRKRAREEARLRLVASMRRALADKEQAVKDREKRIEEARKSVLADKKRLREERARLARGEEQRIRRERMAAATNTGALWRSAVLPGWGQTYLGSEWKGYGFVGLSVALLGAAAATSSSAASTRSSYESDPLRFVGFIGQSALGLDSTTNTTLAAIALNNRAVGLSSAESAASNARTASLLFVSFYVYNLIDAYLFRPAVPRAMDTVTARSDAGHGSFFFSLQTGANAGRPTPGRLDGIRAGFTGRF